MNMRLTMKPSVRGSSKEEKKERLLLWFHHSHVFYSLKEIEKDGAKASGVSPMQIKELLGELVGDSLVSVEKCGSTNIYWSFPFVLVDRCLKQLAAAKLRLLASERRQTKIREELKAISVEESTLHTDKDWENLRIHVDSLKSKIKSQNALARSLTEETNRTKVPTQLITDAISFYSDSIESMISYFNRTLGNSFDESLLRRELNIPAEFDEIPELEPDSPVFEVIYMVKSSETAAK